jgi:hypothetical protein
MPYQIQKFRDRAQWCGGAPYYAGSAARPCRTAAGINLLPSLIVSPVGLFLAGALVSQVTERSWRWTGTRQLPLGGSAAALTHAVGALVGTGIDCPPLFRPAVVNRPSVEARRPGSADGSSRVLLTVGEIACTYGFRTSLPRSRASNLVGWFRRVMTPSPQKTESPDTPGGFRPPIPPARG